MTNHTPGPWAFTPHGTSEGDVATVYGTSQGWVSIHAPGWENIGDKKVADANVRLIAAAPDLLAVLKELQESVSYWSEYDVPVGIVDRINAAIAKATGETE